MQLGVKWRDTELEAKCRSKVFMELGEKRMVQSLDKIMFFLKTKLTHRQVIQQINRYQSKHINIFLSCIHYTIASLIPSSFVDKIDLSSTYNHNIIRIGYKEGRRQKQINEYSKNIYIYIYYHICPSACLSINTIMYLKHIHPFIYT